MNYKDTTLLLLRLAIVSIFLYHGIPKLLNIEQTSQFFSSLGLPGIAAPVVGIIEVGGALLLLLGLWYKWATYLLVVVIAGAIIMVQIKGGIKAGLERDLLILISTLVLAAHGPGHFSLHRKRK